MIGCFECAARHDGKAECDACALERERARIFRDEPKNRRELLTQDARDWVTDDDDE